jgi:hypothetical protein
MADISRQKSVTRLLSLDLTPGKLRGLQRISNANGTLTMVALDQNNSMIGMIQDSDDIVQKFAKPWYGRYGLTMDDFPHIRVAEKRHFRYGEKPITVETASVHQEGEVY